MRALIADGEPSRERVRNGFCCWRIDGYGAAEGERFHLCDDLGCICECEMAIK